MASIINTSDFIGELTIANINQNYVSSALQVFIDKYERKYLKQLFGDVFYSVFVSGQSEQRFTDLIALPEFKEAIASYVYFYWIRDQVSQTVGVGNVKTENANSTLTGAGRKQVRAFNEMVCSGYQIIHYITTSGLFPEYIQPQWLNWRMSLHGWWASDYYYYDYLWNVPEIFCSINENNI